MKKSMYVWLITLISATIAPQLQCSVSKRINTITDYICKRYERFSSAELIHECATQIFYVSQYALQDVNAPDKLSILTLMQDKLIQDNEAYLSELKSEIKQTRQLSLVRNALIAAAAGAICLSINMYATSSADNNDWVAPAVFGGGLLLFDQYVSAFARNDLYENLAWTEKRKIVIAEIVVPALKQYCLELQNSLPVAA